MERHYSDATIKLINGPHNKKTLVLPVFIVSKYVYLPVDLANGARIHSTHSANHYCYELWDDWPLRYTFRGAT